jgi:Do/DeqQ family serine protease
MTKLATISGNFLFRKTFLLLLLFFIAPFAIYAGPFPRENAIVKAIQKVSPAVVNINSEYEIRTRSNPFHGFDSYFDSFFRDFFDKGYDRRQKQNSLGSGVIIDGKRGLILTNEHVIAKSTAIKITLKDKREFQAQIVGADPESDLALLKIVSPEALPSIAMGKSDDLMIGETVIAIGNPFGFSHTVTTGVISAINRSIRTDERIYRDFIQIDASINPGNSGGPLLNINGELIGVNTAIYSSAQGIGFAIPISKANRIVSDLIRYGEVVPAWIGITVQNIDLRLANYLNLSDRKGVIIKRLEPKGPARRAGLQEGDVIVGIGQSPEESPVESIDAYRASMKEYSAGQTIPITIKRGTSTKKFSIKSKVFPLDMAMDLSYRLLGIKVEGLNYQKRYNRRNSARIGVVISALNRNSYLAQIGVEPGDVIRQMDEMSIHSVKDYQKAIVKYHQKSSIVILLQRGDQGYYIPIKL